MLYGSYFSTGFFYTNMCSNYVWERILMFVVNVVIKLTSLQSCMWWTREAIWHASEWRYSKMTCLKSCQRLIYVELYSVNWKKSLTVWGDAEGVHGELVQRTGTVVVCSPVATACFWGDHSNFSCLALVSEKNYCMIEQWINLLNKIGKRHFRIVSVIYLLIARAILIWTLGACRWSGILPLSVFGIYNCNIELSAGQYFGIDMCLLYMHSRHFDIL